MTSNAIEFGKLLELRRSNQAKERTESRKVAGDIRVRSAANVENARHNFATETEAARANRTSEGLTYAQQLETQRANRAKERQASNELGETMRHNAEQERETSRSNRAREYENTRSNIAREDENRRSNMAREYENRRHNLRDESLRADSNTINYAVQSEANRVRALDSSRNYELGSRNASTNFINAMTQSRRAYNDYEVNSQNARSNRMNAETRKAEFDLANWRTPLDIQLAASNRDVQGRKAQEEARHNKAVEQETALNNYWNRFYTGVDTFTKTIERGSKVFQQPSNNNTYVRMR